MSDYHTKRRENLKTFISMCLIKFGDKPITYSNAVDFKNQIFEKGKTPATGDLIIFMQHEEYFVGDDYEMRLSKKALEFINE